MLPFDVYTLGLSNRTWAATVEILAAYRIERVIDIRTLPGSRHAPQFNKEALESELPRAGCEYIHLKALGGLRKPAKDSRANAGWDNPSFRGYADYMQTPEFREALGELVRLARARTTVYACTEAVFWRCHRALVADALLVRGLQAGHIFTSEKCEPHKLTRFARVAGTVITYPADADGK